MATATIRPISDGATLQWILYPDTGEDSYEDIDEDRTQPTAGITTDYIQSDTTNHVTICNLATIANVGTITQVSVWVYAKDADGYGEEGYVSVNPSGSYETNQTIGVSTITSYAWYNKVFDGTWAINGTASIAIRFTCKTGVGSGNGVRVATAYAVVTYNEPVTTMLNPVKYW